MAAILEPRHLPAPVRQGPRPAPRHLRSVPVTTEPIRGGLTPHPADRPDRSLPAAPPVDGAWLTPAAVLGMVATVVVAVALALAVSLGVFAGLVPGLSGGVAATPAVAGGGAAVVVEPGDSYWSIARDLQPTGDVRPLVHRLQLLNGGAALRPGMEVVLPA